MLSRFAVALACAALSSACGDDANGADITGTESTNLSSLCVTIINDYRESRGLAAYTEWRDGHACAATQAGRDAQADDAHSAFGDCGENAQNECPDWRGPEEEMIRGCLERMWDEGPGGGHFDNMASDRYDSVACGFFTTDSGRVWSVQNFR
jgi:hypothetical protein